MSYQQQGGYEGGQDSGCSVFGITIIHIFNIVCIAFQL